MISWRSHRTPAFTVRSERGRETGHPAIAFGVLHPDAHRVVTDLDTYVALMPAAIPLLLVKLWSVYPKLFAKVPVGHRRELEPEAAVATTRGSALSLRPAGIRPGNVRGPS